MLFCISVGAQTAWWLDNDGSVPSSIPNADINLTDEVREKYDLTGEGITIISMADGARLDHEIYEGRAESSLFLNMFSEMPYTTVPDHKRNAIGQQSLGISAGKLDDNPCGHPGIAYKSKVGAFLFYNYTNRIENLQYVVCQKSDLWDIAILTYSKAYCSDRVCYYTPDDDLPHTIIEKCLYLTDDPKMFVVPAPADTVTDLIFAPPLRWPLLFVISGVSSRGQPLNHGSEGSGIFMCCPGVRFNNDTAPGPIGTSLPGSSTECGSEWEFTNASASIFAGGLAVLKGMVKKENLPLGFADYFFILAMTATRVMPYTPLWHQNTFGLWFNRRVGFGRLNVGRACELARKFKSVGKIRNEVVHCKETKVSLDDNEDVYMSVDATNITGTIVSVYVRIEMRDAGFSDLVIMLTSPDVDGKNTTSELKIITHDGLNNKQHDFYFPSYEFLGCEVNGNWTLWFPHVDQGNRGLLVNAQVIFFLVDGKPDPNQINQQPGENPFQDMKPVVNDETIIPYKFKESELYMSAGSSFTTEIEVLPQYKWCPFIGYLENKDSTTRLKIKPKSLNENTTLYLAYVPSVFQDGLPMNLCIESLTPGCSFNARVPVKYENKYPPNQIFSPNSTILLGTKNLELHYSLQMTEVIDDGYSTSASISIISHETKRSIYRSFDRNTGQISVTDIVPSNIMFTLQITPSSGTNKMNFVPLSLDIVQIPVEGNIVHPESPFRSYTMYWIIVLLVIMIALMIWRIVVICIRSRAKRHLKAEDAELLPKM